MERPERKNSEELEPARRETATPTPTERTRKVARMAQSMVCSMEGSAVRARHRSAQGGAGPQLSASTDSGWPSGSTSTTRTTSVMSGPNPTSTAS